jgi:hypothetical protein
MGSISVIQEENMSSTIDRSLLVSLPALAPDASGLLLRTLNEAFAGTAVTVAVPDADAAILREFSDAAPNASLKLASYTPAVRSTSYWTLTPGDFINTHQLLTDHPSTHILLLGSEAQSLSAHGLRELYQEAFTANYDLVTANYALPPRAGLVNSAVLYPVSRALFGSSSRFPLALDLVLSPRMLERLAMAAQRSVSLNQPDALLWPAAEAAAAGFSIGQCDVGPRLLQQPPAPDLNTVLAQVAGAMFADVETKAAVWQRVRIAPTTQRSAATVQAPALSIDEVGTMIEAFRLAYNNLLEVWALVLPPQSLLGLKRLSTAPSEAFEVPNALWARIVYDFIVAYHLRTPNRSHLLGAFTPLYLAWVASHLLQTQDGGDPERHIQLVAAAFEADKPYLVSRWRWPDRFNP